MGRELSEAQKRATQKWDAENLKRMSLAIPITLYNRIKIHGAKTNISTNKFIRLAIEEKLDRDE